MIEIKLESDEFYYMTGLNDARRVFEMANQK
jgi:hypothetical protein